MPKKRLSPKAGRPAGWFVYLVRCRDGSLYTVVATDVDRRCRQHNAGTASRYTRSRLPVRLVYREPHPDRSSALKREAAIKRLDPAAKLALVRPGRRPPVGRDAAGRDRG
jgi:putative endonuclease